MLSKSVIQFSIDGWGCVPSLSFDLRPNYGGDNKDNDLLQKVPCTHCCTRCPYIAPGSALCPEPQGAGAAGTQATFPCISLQRHRHTDPTIAGTHCAGEDTVPACSKSSSGLARSAFCPWPAGVGEWNISRRDRNWILQDDEGPAHSPLHLPFLVPVGCLQESSSF